jgi:hypothetical protein
MSRNTCLICVQQETTKLISLCIELGLDLRTSEDVKNLILVSGYGPDYKDPEFIERVIELFLNLI